MSAPIIIQAELDLSRMRAGVEDLESTVGQMSPDRIYKEMVRAADAFVKRIEAAKIGGGGSFLGGLLSGVTKYVDNIGRAKIAWKSVYDAQIAGGATVEAAQQQANTWAASSVAEMSGGLKKLQGAAQVLAERFGAGAGVAGAVGVAAVGAVGLYGAFKLASGAAGGITKAVTGVGSAFGSIFGALGSIGGALSSAFSFVWDIGANIVSSIGGALSYVGGFIADTFSSAFSYVKDIVGGVFSWMKNTVFSAVGAWLGTVSFGVGVLAVAGGRLSKMTGKTAKADDDPTKDFGFLQNVIEASGEAISRFIDRVQVLFGGWFTGTSNLVETAAGYLSMAIDWFIPKIENLVVTVLGGVLQVISIADSIAGAVYALFSGDFAAAGAMVINAAVKVVEGVQALLKMFAPQINWVVDKIAQLAGGVLSLIAKGFAYIESPLKTVFGFIMTVGSKIFEVVIDIAATAMEFFSSGSSVALNSSRSAQYGLSLAGSKMTNSASAGTWAVALETAAKSISDSGAAGIDAAGAMDGVLGELGEWLTGVSTALDKDADAKYGGLLDPAKQAIEKLLKTMGMGSIDNAEAAKTEEGAAGGGKAVESIDSVLGAVNIGQDRALSEQKKTLTEQKKTNEILGRIQNKGGALT